MSLNTIAPTPAPVPPTPPNPPAGGGRNPIRLLLWIVVAFILAVPLLGVAAVLVFRSSPVIESGAAIVESAEESDLASPDGVTPVPVAVDAVALNEVADTFAASWLTGDFDMMAAVATDSVVDTVRTSKLAGSVVTVTESLNDRGGEFLVDDGSGGPALIYSFTFDHGGDTVRIDTLTCTGDAG